MIVRGIKTHVIKSDDVLLDILDRYIVTLTENSILVITSKIISILENQLISKDGIDKKALIIQESDMFLESQKNIYDFYLTIKKGVLIPSSGIDESNSNNHYILYPKDIEATILIIWNYLKKRDNLQNLGIVISDSHSTLMRRGLTGIALSWIGFKPINSYVGKEDIYGEPLKVTKVNVIDALATSAVFVMGEGNETIPFAVIQNAPNITYVNREASDLEKQEVYVALEDDLYIALLSAGKWVKR